MSDSRDETYTQELGRQQRQCRHVAYIQSSFLGKVLKLEEPEVVNEDKHRCYIPNCPGKVTDDLKAFFTMGNPPIDTYHPINYIGIGIHSKEVDTPEWYTAYVPINIQSFDNDVYKLSRALLRLIDCGSLWLPPVVGGGGGDNVDVDVVDGADNGHNVFRPQFRPLGVTDPNRYIFATPSCMYATMPEVASTLSFKGLPVNLRVIIEVRVKPYSYTVGGASAPNVEPNLDSCFPNDAIEWYIENVDHIVPQRILFRIMKKENEQQEPPSSQAEIPVKFLKNMNQQKCNNHHQVDLIAVMPSSSVLFVTEDNFQALRGIYSGISSKEAAATATAASSAASVTFHDINTSGTGGVSRESSQLGGGGGGCVGKGKGWNSDNNNNNKRIDKPVTVIGKGMNLPKEEDEFLNIKLKWTEHNNKVIFYLKSLINTKWLVWDSGTKVWRINRIFMYEAVKFSLFIGLRVCDKVLFAVWSWLQSIDMRGIGDVFSKTHFTQWISTSKIWAFQRVKICIVPGFNPAIHKDVGGGGGGFGGDGKKITPSMQALAKENAETVEIHLIPFNKEVVAKFKERNITATMYVWQKTTNSWISAQLKSTLEDLLTVLPNLKEMCEKDTYLSSRGINLRDLNRAQKRRQHGQLNVPLKRVNRGNEVDETDSEEEFTTVTKLIITAAGKGVHLMRLKDKIKDIIAKVEPPSSSISASGKVIHGGAGTGGIEFVEMPRGCEAWNTVSFCVVPDEHEGEIPVDQYDPNLLSSLVAEVFIVKESAIDYLLANYKRWPGPHDTVSYTRWNQIVTKNEPRCWGGNSFDGRQRLAQTRLFCDEDFFITGDNTNSDGMLCRVLIQLGNGKIVNNARDAEYVVITDKLSEEAQQLNRQFGNNDEDLIANTHGARHSTLVTPKFIYDCILQWRLQRPTRSHGHMAF